MTEEKFYWLAPLLKAQPWIRSVEYCRKVPVTDYNLNEMRKVWFDGSFGYTHNRRIFDAYRFYFNAPLLPEDQAWLHVDPILDEERPIVVARSPRFHNERFPWPEICRNYGGAMRFVGLNAEYVGWSRRFGSYAQYVPVTSALELARIIAGAQLFIGNQSFPMALAFALNVPLIQETCLGTPDCIFDRPNATYFRFERITLPPLKSYERRRSKETGQPAQLDLPNRLEAGERLCH